MSPVKVLHQLLAGEESILLQGMCPALSCTCVSQSDKTGGKTAVED